MIQTHCSVRSVVAQALGVRAVPWEAPSLLAPDPAAKSLLSQQKCISLLLLPCGSGASTYNKGQSLGLGGRWSESCPFLPCCVTHVSYSTSLVFSSPEGFHDLGDQVEADVRESSGGGGALEAFLPDPSGPMSHLLSPDFGCRCQTLGLGTSSRAKPFHNPDLGSSPGRWAGWGLLFSFYG